LVSIKVGEPLKTPDGELLRLPLGSELGAELRPSDGNPLGPLL
jgi:hypothetical protein